MRQEVVINGDINLSLAMDGDSTLDMRSDGEAGIVEIVNRAVTNYEALSNLPQIEGVTLIGNKSFAQLNMVRMTNSELEEMLT